ncbi:DUF6636 domain-containing protein [Paracoccus siganidrum]|uniref:Uncharacterized protein n=2 Tax=Paracoccus siganidrum TaxID=1276757 RepID=A0A419A157_9RHOB|nr:DUF6636 domain-containing protein [Paracoccus siganidrum]RJL06597.1 hypothetical protein D3P05_18110 [Paracoccus siganidrum]RMC34618.1 hypothetical protein C9E82_12060 [Paracoccus siganidrum]
MLRAVVVCLLMAMPAVADVFTFETPSGNVDCSVGMEADGADIICVIHDRHGPPALPRPAGCNAAWGHVFMMRDRGPVQMACRDPGPNVQFFEQAPYGVTGEFGGFTCHSSQQGLECRNQDGRGFFLSRAVQRVF